MNLRTWAVKFKIKLIRKVLAITDTSESSIFKKDRACPYDWNA
jgi:hypothetical protein